MDSSTNRDSLRVRTSTRNLLWIGLPITMVATLCQALSNWWLLLMITRNSSATGAGEFAMALAIAGPLMAFFQFQLRTLLVTQTQVCRVFNNYMALRACGTLVCFSLLVTTLLTVPVAPQLSQCILLVSLAKAIEGFSDLFHAVIDAQKRQHISAFGIIIRSGVTLALCGWQISTDLTASGVAAGMAASAAITMLLYDLPQCGRFITMNPQRIANEISGKESLRILYDSLPLTVVLFSGTLKSNIPRYVIAGISGLEAVGVFSSIVYLVVGLTSVGRGLTQAALPNLAHASKSGGNAESARLNFLLIVFCVSCGLILLLSTVVLGANFLVLAYGSSYAIHYWILVAVMSSASINFAAIPADAILRAGQRFKTVLMIAAVTSLVTLLFSAVLIPAFGMIGGAIAMILSAAVTCACQYSQAFVEWRIMRHDVLTNTPIAEAKMAA